MEAFIPTSKIQVNTESRKAEAAASLTSTKAASHDPHGDAAAVEQASGKRRTRYLQPDMDRKGQLDILDEYAPQALSTSGGAVADTLAPITATKGKGAVALNPSFTAIPAPKNVFLQAADTRLTPRLGHIQQEQELKPVEESFYHPDAATLRRGTPDLEDKLGKEFSKASTQLHMPNFLGEGELLQLVPGRDKTSDLDLGPAPDGTRKKRARTPKKKSKKQVVVEAPKDNEEAQPEEDVVVLAKDLIMEESHSLSAEVHIPEEDRKIMAQPSDGKPPAPLDDKMAHKLEEIWETLEMPMLEKLGMVVKYSELQRATHLQDSLEMWKDAADAVRDREDALQKLANRLSHIKWDKQEGEDPSTAAEVKQMKDDIANYSGYCSRCVERLMDRYGDVVTYKGMPYQEDLECSLVESLERVMGGTHIARSVLHAAAQANAFAVK
mmetsp:Transcript_16304/g.25308  ORF Transcript_16304/g.25308 Transcript_16304/m.25308 type:complete len:439 (-) Transcript_16304:89-1405(-)|eukprot:CAMPEP_0184330034 /NCGR_PEP_ID=MMETSP1049-20130417/144467_1 /TAXON_ID=77928 /ORGANISM="Proteomonas sulcata, Strain CCMP704" /LENGTH=438 /DNA_ID=CAMNT_0026652439 /DNA_START=13 /DNA_END=1329 /DNA_ORIENTATION=-